MTSDTETGRLAVVTGASSGIGLELARRAAQEGFNLIIASDEAEIEKVAQDLRNLGSQVDALQVDLATVDGVSRLVDQIAAAGHPVDLLMANAGRGLGHAFLDQNINDAQFVVNTNISGTIRLVHEIGNRMRTRGKGRILLTGSIAGFMPGSFQAVYNGTKAFINSFALALRDELKDSGVTVTCLMPGATDTDFFEQADMTDSPVGEAKKDDPAYVAKIGFEAMMDGEGDVVSGWKNKVLTAVANVTPAGILATGHRKMSEPNSDKK